MTSNKTAYIVFACGLYGLFLVYGTLFPILNFAWQPENFKVLFTNLNTVQITKPDLITNLIVYIPLGFLIASLLVKDRPFVIYTLLATCAGCVLSLSLELLQTQLPGRVPSLLDLLLNTVGAGLGGAIFSLMKHAGSGQIVLFNRILSITNKDLHAKLAASCIGVWIASQTAPFAPSIDVGLLWSSVKPVWLTLNSLDTFQWMKLVEYLCAFIIIALLLEYLLNAKGKHTQIFLALLLLTVLLKIIVVSRVVSLEMLLALLCALTYPLLKRFLSPEIRPHALVLLTIIYILADQLKPGSAATFNSINWIPFSGQMSSLSGFIDILETAWPFTVIALANILALNKSPSSVLPWKELFSVVFLAFGVEWAQQYTPGRFPDVTDVFIAVLGWFALHYLARYLHLGSTQKSLSD
ncbi:MAG: VanZ family protein [Gammaproteobacteria bacterium]|nr:VanZ family protein [Gammaproteobacteria bacterium]